MARDPYRPDGREGTLDGLDPPAYRTRFGGLDIAYDETVLEPRGWTLSQSLAALELLATAPPGPMLELCCGAGHIGLVAAVRSGRPLVQVDVSASACRWARRNAAAAGVADRVTVRCIDLANLADEPVRYGVAIADPPYLPTGEVARHRRDPVGAVDGGADGLELARSVVDVLAVVLAPGGAVVVQSLDHAQAVAVSQLLPTGLVPDAIRTVDGGGALLLARRCEAADPRGR